MSRWAREAAIFGGIVGSVLAVYYGMMVIHHFEPLPGPLVCNGTRVPTFLELHFGQIFLLIICGAIGLGCVGAFFFLRKLVRKLLPGA